jgi:ABC-type dipeptide/oligopeptide/nickel transport system permease subunit
MRNQFIYGLRRLYAEKDILWSVIWMSGMTCCAIWDAFYLNTPAFELLSRSLWNSFFCGVLVVALSLTLGWLTGIFLNHLEDTSQRTGHFLLSFFLNLLRSIPQIVGVLLGYVFLTYCLRRELITDETTQLLWMAVTITLFTFQEVKDLIRDRIQYFKRSDFYAAMLCCGINENRIVNVEIIWKNSLAHLFQKSVSIFGAALFLQCSIDFVISVGLSTDVSLSNFPATLGSMLARMDSKQDILAIGTTLTNPAYIPHLFTTHLQGISVAFIIVFTLLCVFRIANGLIKRYELS